MLAGFLLLVMLGALVVLWVAMESAGGMEGLTAGGNRVAVIRIEGLIMSGRGGFSFLGGPTSGSDDIVAEIERATGDEEVKAILVRINSPGGSAAASQEIYQAIRRARKAGKVVVASMADMAASGGYYVAAPAEAIYAAPATLTGSIGVIVTHQDMSELLTKIGVKSEAVKSGELKDMLSPTRPLDEKQRAVIEALVAEVYEQFVADVAAGRGMDREKVIALADGRIYTGSQAKANGLVDELGGFQEALLEAGHLAGIEGKPRIKEYRAPSLLDWMLRGTSARAPRMAVTGGLLYDDFAARLVRGGVELPVPSAEP